MLAAAAQVGVRGLTRKESISSIVFYFGLISTVISAVPAAGAWVTPPLAVWPMLLAMGLSATAAQLLMTRAYRGAPAAQVGPFIYTSVVFGAGIDWLVFDKLPDLPAALGSRADRASLRPSRCGSRPESSGGASLSRARRIALPRRGE